MSKPPTAEEVLGLYCEMVSAGELFRQCESRQSELFHNWGDATARFSEALEQWQSSRGPVTRKWFVERFGKTDINCKNGKIIYWCEYDSFELVVSNGDGMFTYVDIDTPTRSDIDTLVRLLGGNAN